MKFLSSCSSQALNQSFLNLKQANLSFTPLGALPKLITHSALSSRMDETPPSTNFSWQRTWNSSDTHAARVNLKSRYYKGKMYSLIPAKTQLSVVAQENKQFVDNILDCSMLCVMSFSVCSFCTFLFAVYQRLGAL
jgi:hypothetical protein